MQIVFLGTGTSHGIPVIGCGCEVCSSNDPRNTRDRASVMLVDGDTRIIIDTGPDFRKQMLRERVTDIDAVLLTHDHADHLNGIDDLRVFSRDKHIPVYASGEVLNELQTRFSYIFTSKFPGGGIPRLMLHELEDSQVTISRTVCIPVPIRHGCRMINGFRMGDMAYLTDCSGIPETSYRLLDGVKLLVIGALRYRKHPTHFSIDEAVAAAQRIGAGQTYLTHLCHDVDQAVLERELPEGILPAYDGLSLEIDQT